MPLFIVKNNITRMKVDAVVNAANSSLTGGGGVDGAIHMAAGRELDIECAAIKGGCPPGEVRVTKGYNMPCKFILHTVGPVWHGGYEGEEEILTACYLNCLRQAAALNCESVAFPLISSGVYGYPKRAALSVAENTVNAFLESEDDGGLTVYIVLFSKADADALGDTADVKHYVETNFQCVDYEEIRRRPVDNRADYSEQSSGYAPKTPGKRLKQLFIGSKPADEEETELFDACLSAPEALNLERMLENIDESFAEMLIRKIDAKGITDAQCYKKANVDRRLFNKIKLNSDYRASKSTVLAFAVALELGLEETKEMLSKAGYSFTHSSVGDIIVEYYILNGNFNIIDINEALFAHDQMLLGSV